MQQATCNRSRYHNYSKSCKEMGGVTSVIPVIRDASPFSQQAADNTPRAHAID